MMTIIHAPSSTKNESKERDPEMHQTKKNDQWYVGMKAHVGVDSKQASYTRFARRRHRFPACICCPIYCTARRPRFGATPGKVSRAERGDPRGAVPQAQDMTNRRATNAHGAVGEVAKRRSRNKLRVRARMEWPFRILKRVFGFTKVRYRGLKKNHEWLCAGFALANSYQHRRRDRPASNAVRPPEAGAGLQR